jgi:hypothetical protein
MNIKKAVFAILLLAAMAGSAQAQAGSQGVSFLCWRCQYFVWSGGFAVAKSCPVSIPFSHPWCTCTTGLGKFRVTHYGTVYNACIKPK